MVASIEEQIVYHWRLLHIVTGKGYASIYRRVDLTGAIGFRTYHDGGNPQPEDFAIIIDPDEIDDKNRVKGGTPVTMGFR